MASRVPEDWVWAYHTTPGFNLASIKASGLRPEWHSSVPDAPVIFVERDLEGLDPYIHQGSAVLRFKTPGFGATQDGEDVIFGGPGASGRPDAPLEGSVGSDGMVPPDRIEVLDERGRWVPLAETSLGPEHPSVGADVPGEKQIKGTRFDGFVSRDGLRADIVDKIAKVHRIEKVRRGKRVEDTIVERPGLLTTLSIENVGEVGVIAGAGLQGALWDIVPIRRFRPRGHVDRDGVDIVDPVNLTKLVQLDRKALTELEGLSLKLMESMTSGGPRS